MAYSDADNDRDNNNEDDDSADYCHFDDDELVSVIIVIMPKDTNLTNSLESFSTFSLLFGPDRVGYRPVTLLIHICLLQIECLFF